MGRCGIGCFFLIDHNWKVSGYSIGAFQSICDKWWIMWVTYLPHSRYDWRMIPLFVWSCTLVGNGQIRVQAQLRVYVRVSMKVWLQSCEQPKIPAYTCEHLHLGTFSILPLPSTNFLLSRSLVPIHCREIPPQGKVIGLLFPQNAWRPYTCSTTYASQLQSPPAPSCWWWNSPHC